MITYYTHEVNILSSSPFEFLNLNRPEEYDPDLYWDEILQDWVSSTTGGGRYSQKLIAISEDGNIFFG
jgi:hypothetical protein